MWHASGSGLTYQQSAALAEQALRGVGDPKLGEWRERGDGTVFHIRRRLAEWEQRRYGVLHVRDIRGTNEETWRLKSLVRDAPHLAEFFPQLFGGAS